MCECTWAVAALGASISVGKQVTFTVKLPKAARAALAAGARESVKFTLTATNSHGHGTTTKTIPRLKFVQG